MTTSIVTFIRKALEAERAQAQAALDSEFQQIWFDTGNIDLAECYKKHGPERVLREVDCDLAILDAHDYECCSVCLDDVDGCPYYRALAYKHADHPEWQPHWVPDGRKRTEPMDSAGEPEPIEGGGDGRQ